MRTLSLVLGIIALITGGIWSLQGVGILPGSFMSGQTEWLLIGLLVTAVGLGMIYNGIRRTAPR